MDAPTVQTTGHPAGPTTRRPPRTGAGAVGVAGTVGPAGLAAVASATVALALTGGLPAAVPAGLPDPGVFTGWGLRLVTVLTHLTAACAVGSLLVGAVLIPARPDGRLSEPARAAVVHAAPWAGAWAVITACRLLLLASDVAAVPVARLDADALAIVVDSSQGRALVGVVLVASVVAAAAGRVRTTGGGRALLVVALAGLVPVTVTGHASSAADHDVVSAALVVHVAAATLWVGGLAGLVLQLRSHPAELAVTVPRFSTVALASYVALAGSGLIAVTARLGTSLDAWSSGYGALATAKAAALVGLGLLGLVHRRRIVPRLGADRPAGPFLRLAGVELAVMGAATGLASALSRTEIPPTTVVAQPQHGTGHSSLAGVIRPVSLTELATSWRPHAVVLLVLGLALTAYLSRVGVLRRRGLAWPRARTSAYVVGLLVALVSLCSGVATYAPAMISVQVAQLLVTLLAVPALLLLGAPLRLAEQVGRVTGSGGTQRLRRSRAARVAANPVVGAVAASAVVLAVYRTPLIEATQRSSWLHLAVLSLALGAGLLLLWPVLGVDVDVVVDPAVVRRAGAAAERTWCLAAVAGCLGLLAVQLGYGDRLLAAEWFLELRWGWVDPVADQRRAGGVVAVAAAGVLALAVALAVVRRRVPEGEQLNG